MADKNGEQRLIDSKNLLKKVLQMIDYCGNDNQITGLTALFQVADAIMNCRTIDTAPVVRCKDCKYHFKNRGDKLEERYSEDCESFFDSSVNDDDYCSYGERKNDDA